MEVIHWIWIKKLWKTKISSWIYIFSPPRYYAKKVRLSQSGNFFCLSSSLPVSELPQRYLIKLISSVCAKKKFHGFSSEKICVVIKSIHIFCDIFAVICGARVRRCGAWEKKDTYIEQRKAEEKNFFLLFLLCFHLWNSENCVTEMKRLA